MGHGEWCVRVCDEGGGEEGKVFESMWSRAGTAVPLACCHHCL